MAKVPPQGKTSPAFRQVVKSTINNHLGVGEIAPKQHRLQHAHLTQPVQGLRRKGFDPGPIGLDHGQAKSANTATSVAVQARQGMPAPFDGENGPGRSSCGVFMPGISIQTAFIASGTVLSRFCRQHSAMDTVRGTVQGHGSTAFMGCFTKALCGNASTPSAMT